ncbi:ArsR family transcriptional regulator [Bacillus manliponensis]|uniref:ArsR family transcriptional regulator n=1 Tax=Bacillus manliponensis TaxID=574376 RepID=A0A073JZH7_9BACI|nr:metalloregulator ArsR/SmtB family transcription factor [Bacillus manliponensis]KEK19612.1 ArsR family transcriptional regulator [Bacillus manliponensis]
MDVLNITSRKRESYKVQIKYSLLWECALGIAAITNKRFITTLEKQQAEWEEIRESFDGDMLEQLNLVEKHNTWKALLQLLYEKDFAELSHFIRYIRELSGSQLKYICIPYTGVQQQEIRRRAADGEEDAIEQLKEITNNNPFFPTYIEYICKIHENDLKEHLIAVMSGWYKVVIESEAEMLCEILKVDYETKEKMKDKMAPEEFVEWVTGGISYMPEPSVHSVLLIPQYTYRPWNIEADIEGTKVFHYPVANESIAPNDPYKPNYFVVQKYKALGDEVRLRIVKLLYEQDRTLQQLTDKLDVGKSTIHHHLKILRAAKLVDIGESKYILKKKALQSLGKELDLFINR